MRLIGLTTGTIVYLFLIALILGIGGRGDSNGCYFSWCSALFFIYAGGLLEINARIEYLLAPDTTRLLYSSLIVAGLLFVPALMVHCHLEFYEMAGAVNGAVVEQGARSRAALCRAIVVRLPCRFSTRRPQGIGVRFGPRFGPLDQIAPRLVRFFPWTPEATFIFVAILLSLAIDLGILNLKPKLADADRRFFKWMVGVSAVAWGYCSRPAISPL